MQGSASAMPVSLLLPFSLQTAAKGIFLKHRPPAIPDVAWCSEHKLRDPLLHYPPALVQPPASPSLQPSPLLSSSLPPRPLCSQVLCSSRVQGTALPHVASLLFTCGFWHPTASPIPPFLTASLRPFWVLEPNPKFTCCMEPYHGTINYALPDPLFSFMCPSCQPQAGY